MIDRHNLIRFTPARKEVGNSLNGSSSCHSRIEVIPTLDPPYRGGLKGDIVLDGPVGRGQMSLSSLQIREETEYPRSDCFSYYPFRRGMPRHLIMKSDHLL